jgi:hypothetical protein
MQPIVNVLETEYGKWIEFRSIDANSAEGKQAFQAYQLLGHPGYVLLNQGSEVLWIGIGEQSGDQIESKLEAAISK